MKILQLCFLMLMATLWLPAQLTTDWAIQNTGSYGDYGHAVFVDGSGNVYSSGKFTDSIDLDPGPGVYYLNTSVNYAGYLQKLDANGNFVWARGTENNLEQNGRNMTGDASGNVFLGAPVSGGEYGITKFDANGNEAWTSIFEQTTALLVLHAMATDAGGNVYCTGNFTGTIDFDPGSGTSSFTGVSNEDLFIVKLDGSTGALSWAKQISPVYNPSFSGKCTGTGIAIDPSGNVITAGYFEDSVDFDPGPGTVYYEGETGDIFVMKLDANGNFLWAKEMGGFTSDEATAVTTDGSGNILLTGIFSTTADFDPGAGSFLMTTAIPGYHEIFVEKLDPNGNFIWAKQLNTDFYHRAYSIVCNSSGDVYTTGFIQGTTDFDPGPGYDTISSQSPAGLGFIHKLDANGNYGWVHIIEETGGIICQSLVLDQNANIYVTGTFSDSIFATPGSPMIAVGSTDAFVAKFSDNTVAVDAKTENKLFSVYPNPVSFADRICLDFGEIIVSGSMEMLSIEGKVVFATEIRNQDKLFIQPDVPAGLYLIRVSGSGKPMVSKLAVE